MVINRIILLIGQSRMVGQASQMIGWQLVSKLFSFFAAVWTARCLGPEKMGVSGLVLQTVAPLTLITTLSLENLVVREYKHRVGIERENLIKAYSSLRFSLGVVYVCLGICVLLVFFRNTPYLWGGLIAIPYFILNANNATWLLMAREDMPNNSKSNTVAAIICAILTFVFFRPGQAVFSDVVVLGMFAGIIFTMTWRAASPLAFIRYLGMPYLREGLQLAWKGRWICLTGLAIYIYIGLENQLIGYMNSRVELGKYQTANRLIVSLQQLLNVATVLIYPRVIEWYKQGNEYAWRMQLKATVVLALIGLIISVGALLLSPLFYRTFYGPEYVDAAIPFALLVISKCLVMTGSVFAFGMYAKLQDKTYFFISLCVALVSISLNLYAIPRHGMMGAATVNVCSELLVQLTFFAFIVRLHCQQRKQVVL